MIIQGGGNSLVRSGAVLQWMKLVDCIKGIWEKNSNVTIGIVGITRRMKAEREFEHERERSEDIWGEEILR